jgi:hypothetical protein
MKVKVYRAATDPTCETRISVGGGPKTGGYYCTFRGDRLGCVYALEEALLALKRTDDDFPVSPEIRKIGDNSN